MTVGTAQIASLGLVGSTDCHPIIRLYQTIDSSDNYQQGNDADEVFAEFFEHETPPFEFDG